MEHSFDIDVAKAYGIFQAVLIKNFQFWIIKNKANDKHFYDGHWWTYNSQKALNELFPYKTKDQIRRAVDDLVESNVLMRGNYNKVPMDRTCWYAFVDENVWLQNCQMQVAKLPNASGENATPIPYNKPDINTSPTNARESEEDLFKVFLEWLYSSMLKEQAERTLFRESAPHDLQYYAEEFFDNDFSVRERVLRRERTDVLKHFQSWLTTFIRKEKENDNNGTDKESKEDIERRIREQSPDYFS